MIRVRALDHSLPLDTALAYRVRNCERNRVFVPDIGQPLDNRQLYVHACLRLVSIIDISHHKHHYLTVVRTETPVLNCRLSNGCPEQKHVYIMLTLYLTVSWGLNSQVFDEIN